YVEYGIAQLGALQVWARSKENPIQALTDYKRSLRLGGSRPLPELFSAAGCRFDFSAKTVKPLVALVRQELEALNLTNAPWPVVYSEQTIGRGRHNAGCV